MKVDAAARRPGSPEVELDRQDGVPVYIEGEKNRMGNLALTNDRILFVDQKVLSSGNLVGDLIGAAIQERHERKEGGPRELVRLADLRGAGLQQRRFVPDLYVLTLADGRTCRTHRKLRKRWDAELRRLVSERHGRVITDDGGTWRVTPAG